MRKLKHSLVNIYSDEERRARKKRKFALIFVKEMRKLYCSTNIMEQYLSTFKRQ